jgi:hypothetical protein
MKIPLFLTTIFVILASRTLAQSTTPHRGPASSGIVHDSAGNIIPKKEADSLMDTGHYDLIRRKDLVDPDYFQLIHLSDIEQERLALQRRPRMSENFPLGDSLTFSGKGLDGKIYSSAKLKGKIIVLHILEGIDSNNLRLTAHCELVDSFGKSDKVIFLVLVGESTDMARLLIPNLTSCYIPVMGQERRIMSWRVRTTPQDIILDEEGRVAFSSVGMGAFTIYWLKKRLRELLGNKK